MNLKNNHLLKKTVEVGNKKILNFNIYRPAIKENTASVVVACQNILLIWYVILNYAPW